MKIALASDHGGYELKEKIYNYLLDKGYDVINFGTDSSESCDYPIFAKKVCNAILNDNFERGILICGTGIGMSMMANRFKGIRAVNAPDTVVAYLARKDENANVLTLGARLLSFRQMLKIIKVFLTSEFEGGRHCRRIAKY